MKKKRIGQSPDFGVPRGSKKKIKSEVRASFAKRVIFGALDKPRRISGTPSRIFCQTQKISSRRRTVSTAPHTSIQRGSTREFCTSWETRNRRWERVVRVWAAMCSPRASSIPVMLMHPMTRGDPNIVECFFHANSARAKGLAAAIPQRWGCRLRHPCQLNIPSIQTSQTIVSKTRTRWARKFNAYRYSLRRSRKGGRPWHVQRHAIQENSTPSNTS